MAPARRLISTAVTIFSFLFPFLVALIWRRSAPPAFLLYWPVLVCAAFLFSFGRTLWSPPPFVERFARLQNPNLGPVEVAYCRRVTQVWCLFFIVNGSIALALALKGSLKAWALYCGCISYLLIGALFAAEYLYRRWRFRR
jgi:uncharacterized membrane protein